MTLNDKHPIITCPCCGAEYLPVEIFIPDSFFGSPIHIERDENNKIVDVVGDQMLLDDNYTCDYCKVPFKISSKITFNTKMQQQFDFNNDYSTKLKKASLFMTEED